MTIRQIRKELLKSSKFYENWANIFDSGLGWIISLEREFADFLMIKNHTLIDEGSK